MKNTRFRRVGVVGTALCIAGFVAAQTTSSSWRTAAALPAVKGKKNVEARILQTDRKLLTIRYRIPELSLSEVLQNDTNEQRSRIELGNAPRTGKTGEPVLPVVPVQFIIPPGQEIAEVSVTPLRKNSTSLPHPVEYGIAPVPLLRNAKVVHTRPKKEIYTSNQPFPLKNSEQVSVQMKRGIAIGIVNIHPVVYYPKSGRIEYYQECEITVSFKTVARLKQKKMRLRASRNDVKRLGVENPEAIQEYRNADTPSQQRQKMPEQQLLLDPAGSYRYVVITSETMRDAVTDVTINDLIAQRRQQGLTTTLMTIEQIIADYTGVDTQEKVRNFITDAYTNWETEYVVLGGDVSIIPIRDLYTDGELLHSDLYYQCLDGSYNDDGDTYWGEPNDGIDGGDVDMFADVNVGRISAETPEELSNAVYKILTYENDDDAESYLGSNLLLGEELGSQFGPDMFSFAYPYMCEIKNGSSAAGYTTVGFSSAPAFSVDSLYDYFGTWQAGDLMSRINSNQFSIINHLGHANYDYVMKMSNMDADALTNDKFLFVFTQGCFPGDMTEDCVAEHLTTSTRHGIFAGVFNSHYGYGDYNESIENLDSPSQRIHRQFWDAYFGEYTYNLGAILADSHEDNIWNINADLTRWCIYETNLFGDPFTVLRGQTQGPKVVYSSVATDDRTGGNDDGIINPGEQISCSVILKNIGNAAATGVTADLIVSDPFITIAGGTLSFGDIPCCGVTATSQSAATITVAENCPTPYSFPVSIEIADNERNTWDGSFTLTVNTTYTISGRVVTRTGAQPIADAPVTVSGPLSGTVTTNASGEYLFAGIEGNYTVLAKVSGYLPVEPVQVTLPPNATAVDFMVSRPEISVDPTSISHTMEPGSPVDLPLVITNSGDADLQFVCTVVDRTAPELSALKLYDPSHFIRRKKGTADTRIGRPVALGSGGPDRFGYRWSDSDELNGPVYRWNDISGTGTLLREVSNCDDCYEEQELSFSFPFYDIEFSSVFVGSNGYLTFGEGSDILWNVPLPSIEAPPNLVAAFFDDLYPAAGGAIYFQDFGSYAVVQFTDVPLFDGSGTVTFQMVIEATGSITWYYKSLTGRLTGVTAGIQNGAMDDGLTVVYNADHLKNELAVQLRAAPGWLSVTPETGIVTAGETMPLAVAINSTDLFGGEYRGAVVFRHNDPRSDGTLEVPVTLNVDGFKSLTVAPARCDFGNLWLGRSDTMQVTLSNTGTQSTVINAVTGSSPSFGTDAALPLRVRPGRSATIGITFTPQMLGSASGTVTIASDAEDNPSLAIDISGVATPGPRGSLAPATLSFTFDPNDTPADRTAILANIGGDILSWRTLIRQKTVPSLAAAVSPPPGEKSARREHLIYSPYNYRHEFVLDRVIIAFIDGKTDFADPSLATKLGSGDLRELATARIPGKGIRAYTGKKLAVVPLANASREGVLEAIKELRKDINVAYAEPDYTVKKIGLPDDPLFTQQYALQNSGQTGGTADADIDAPEAWDVFTGAISDVILGIIDTGIDYLHPDLAGNLWTNPGEIPDNGIDDDGNGYIDDIHGYDFAYDDNDPMDVYGHGTHCSGIAAARGNDATGICGVSWGAKLLA
ncbi:MAG: choice-of-anchor D domain-containing protein, partial [Chitinispirillaceae bacterium]|nr:choice-of-anchor D domain-containing protein [Chitinispirillaceae bacterium]